MYVMARKKLTVPISTARAELFTLSDMVRNSADGTFVVLEQRGEAEQVALVRESRLAYLEARVTELDGQRQKRTPFRLAGSLSSALGDDALDEVLGQIRKEWSAAAPASGTPRSRRRS